LERVVTGVLVLAGCGSVRYPTSYLLNLPKRGHQVAPPQTVLGPVAVREFRCPEYLCAGRIAYRPNGEKVGFYEYHRWAISPRQTITQSMADVLQAESILKIVSVYERGIEAAYVLTGNIERLEEVDQGGDVRAVCAISTQLMDARTGLLDWSRTASETVRVQQRDVAGLVRSLSAAVRTPSITWLRPSKPVSITSTPLA
jgi:uncharacterized lipoprotein YmbA